MDPEPLITEDDIFASGTRVEVRNSFDGSWSSGFIVIASNGSGYRLRRRSDDQELPKVFMPEEVRHEHKRSMWWV